MSPILLLACALSADPTSTDTWPGFRGDGTSTSPARDLPLTWSPGENVAWRVPLPGYGQSAPVVWKGRVYVTTSQPGKISPSMSRAAPTPVADAGGVYAFFEGGDLLALMLR